MQAPQREGRVAHPRVAVVPVALAARRLRQRGRERGDHRAGRRVREPLQHERRALQVDAPRMVGEVAVVEPAAPEVRGAVEHRRRLLGRARAVQVGRPRERAEALLALLQRVARAGAVALDPEHQVGARGGSSSRRRSRRRRRSRSTCVHCASRRARSRTPARRSSRSARCPGCTRSCARARGRRRCRSAGACAPSGRCCRCHGPIVSASRTTSQPGRRHPRRLDDVRAGLVAARAGDVDAVRAEAEAAGAAVEQRAEDRSARRSAARTATRSSRSARAARRCGSPTGTRSRRSAGTASAPAGARGRAGSRAGASVWWRSCQSGHAGRFDLLHEPAYSPLARPSDSARPLRSRTRQGLPAGRTSARRSRAPSDRTR